MKTIIKLLKKSLTWLKNLISNSDEASHKRLISFGSFVVLVGMVILKAFGLPIDSTLIYVFAGLCGGQSILTVIDKFTVK